jgi:hypothetical protein
MSSYRTNSHGCSFYRTGGALHSYGSDKPALGSLAWCDNNGVDPFKDDVGRAIRMAAARALSEASYPHLPLKAWERCKVCTILADSLRLLA